MKVQTFFTGGRKRFFTVASSIELARQDRIDFGNAVQTLLKEGERRDQEEDAAKIGDNQLPVDYTP